MKRRNFSYADIMSVHHGVTGSCNLVATKFPDGESVKFVVDCGMFQEEGCEELNNSFPFNAEI